MPQVPTGEYTAPSSTVYTELWYGTSKTKADEQIFGVQSIPPFVTPKEDITYRTLESDSEFAVKGIRPFESLEITCILFPDQFTKLKEKADADEQLHWFVKLSDTTGKTKPICATWQGGFDVSLAEIALDDMYKSVLKIGKTSVPEFIEGLPTTP